MCERKNNTSKREHKISQCFALFCLVFYCIERKKRLLGLKNESCRASISNLQRGMSFYLLAFHDCNLVL